ncbi:hypothetical protein [Kitasatospora sp. NPDC017646]|uniref:hypothetical protein n=1 Tax=Kitasatospora sp. NPDC017646 TaxID=3364024 RepID=UPI0037B53DD8
MICSTIRPCSQRAVPIPLAETALVARPLLHRVGLPVPGGPLSYAIAPDLTIRYARPAASSVGSAGCLGDDDTLLVTGTLRRVLHLAATRLWSWRDEDGDETYWARHLARSVKATALWPALTAEP